MVSVFRSSEALFVFRGEGQLRSAQSAPVVGATAGGVAWLCSLAGEEALTPQGLPSVTSAWGPAVGKC